MKVGDLVKLLSSHGASSRPGLIIDLIEKKCWRTNIHGSKVDWNKIDPEPHAVVLINGDKIAFPITDLVPIDER